MKKRVFSIMAIVAALILLSIVLVLLNGLFGNPVSKFLATNSAEKYIEKNHPQSDFEIDKTVYNFKTGSYFVYVISPNSNDSSFSITVSKIGKIIYDDYQSRVVERWNTAMRIDEEYRNLVDGVFESFPYQTHIDYGEIVFTSREYINDISTPSYALVAEDLELDKIYDINEMAKKSGKITVYIYDNDVSIERLSEIILDLKKVFDENGVAFYAVDCVLESQKDAVEQKRVETMDFLYSDIYEDGIYDRVEASNQAARDYYDEMDNIKEQEIIK